MSDAPRPPVVYRQVFNIPLDSGRDFFVQFPADLEGEDLDYVIEMLRLWRPKICRKPPTDDAAEGEAGR